MKYLHGSAATAAFLLSAAVVLLLMGASFRAAALPYAAVAAAVLAVSGSWTRDARFFLAFAVPVCVVPVLWGVQGIQAGLLLASWGVLWFGLGRWLGGDSPAGVLLGLAVLFMLFSPFYVKRIAPEGGFWLWFSLRSGPVPVLWSLLGRFTGYNGAVGRLLYNRWYGTNFPFVMPSPVVLALSYALPGGGLVWLHHARRKHPSSRPASPAGASSGD
ncbi:MAG: hypothetical protein JW909_03925 [Planctomycetes bacterium]|nr:hypothetical protein [Planctomycetota bacterium]